MIEQGIVRNTDAPTAWIAFRITVHQRITDEVGVSMDFLAADAPTRGIKIFVSGFATLCAEILIKHPTTGNRPKTAIRAVWIAAFDQQGLNALGGKAQTDHINGDNHTRFLH
ncbi:Uncharacterised protein [Vibrio cholerae]|nr:Uncharacterised protein [Vibrio cholerae]CRZ66039.1 Uncharacterised protein [Vibrio cholerae]CSA23439.1 Uncharacterised protein [Vibrio cholerae]CSA43885.1 Uncharacterised protein [Vibrio cholerae]CSA46820.1 Uncharacterised protein [Vibrio cholerae]